MSIKVILTDIEGTTTSLSFVKDILFPYARANIADYVRNHIDDPVVKESFHQVSQILGRELDTESFIQQLILWIDEDKKIGPLKSIQGLIWESGYREKKYYGHIYQDAKQQLEAWHQQGIKLYVYSSGSVYAQKLLFGFTEHGDLNNLFDGNFDTRIGGKMEPQSYKNILSKLDCKATEVLFLSDIEQELDAAKHVGMSTCWLLRESEDIDSTQHQQCKDFFGVLVN